MTDGPATRSLDGPLAPLDAPEPGWTQLPPRSGFAVNNFVSSDAAGPRLRVVWFMRDADQAMVGRAWFGPLCEGPPGHAHGGSIAALLDEAMGSGAWLNGHRAVAAKISIDFRKPVPLGTTVTICAQVERAEGRRVTTRGELVLPGGQVCATAAGLFIVLDVDKLKATLE